MKRRASKLDANVNNAVRKLCVVIDRELVLATPVDTGRARSNWLVSLGSPAQGVREPYAPYPQGSQGGGAGAGEGANASGALEQGAGEIARRAPGQAVYITNNVPYIQRLDAGSSTQAPANFVKRAIQNGAAVFKKLKVLD